VKVSEYCDHDATGLAELIKSRQVSAEEVMKAALAAAERVNPQINAIVHQVEPGKIAATGGPFEGVPFLLKDVIHRWAGVQSTAGSRLGKGFVSNTDGPLAERFRASGLRVFGVANTSEFAIDATTEPVAYGATQNPWKLGHSVGGSSGGSAAAVAAGIVPIAHASDGGGSIRMPAALCGLYGLKPTRGRNPPASATVSDGTAWISVHHVVTKTLRDTVAALDATCGSDPGGFVPLPKPVSPFMSELGKNPGKLRIAFCKHMPGGGASPDDETLGSLLSAAKLLEDMGHTVEEAAPDVSMDEISFICFELFLSGIADTVDAVAAVTGLPIGPETLEPQTLASYHHVSEMPARRLKSALNKLVGVSRRVASFMSNYDVFLTPATAVPAIKNGIFDAAAYGADPMTFWKKEERLYDYMPLASITGEPALAVPFAMSSNGLPIGLQFTAKPDGEALLFRLASQFDAARPKISAMPQVHASKH
jgi:amidase